jgi:hypothetical protein
MFLQTELETLLPYFDKLTAETKPLWGSMTAQRMVEHLTDTLLIACGENTQSLVIPVPFALPDTPLRHEELELAVDEYVDIYLQFEELYESNPELRNVHPYYGPLNHAQWTRLHSKHVTHHFTQFGLI